MTNDERREELFHNLREDCYSVTLYRHVDEYESEELGQFFCYGTPEDIVYTMDCTLENNGYESDDWSQMSATIGYDDWTIVYMSSLDEPTYELVSDVEAFEAFAA